MLSCLYVCVGVGGWGCVCMWVGGGVCVCVWCGVVPHSVVHMRVY